MSNKNTKLDMIDALFSRGEWIRQVNDVEYRTRCPYCGDSQKNFNTGHLYIKINPEDNFPMVWNCFKCNECGIVNKDFLTMMGIENVDLKSSITTLNKTSDKIKASRYYDGIKIIMNDYKIPSRINNKKLEYIENRIGTVFNSDMIRDTKIIFSLKDFLLENNIHEITTSSNIALKLEDHYVGFLSYGASYILFRDITDNEKYPWIKYPITKESEQSKCFYSIATTIDILTEEKITVNLAEGVMDILSAYTNLDYMYPNTMNIAVCGKRYDGIINYLIELGILGSNVSINIFADNDMMFNRNNKQPTDYKYFKKVFRKYKHLFGDVNVYYNILYKDIGVARDKISLKKYKI